MNIARTFNDMQDAFFRWGWLIPAALPLAQVGGRGLFNSIAVAYAVWGLLALWRRRSRLDRMVVLPYLALVGVFLIGIPGAVDPGASLKTWSVFLMLSFSFLLMRAAMGESTGHPDRFLGATALFGVLALAALVLLVPYFAFGWSGVPFSPMLQLKEDGLPFLLPFILGWVWRRGGERWRYGAMAGIALVALAYVVLAQGRAALLGMIVGLAVFCWAVLGWRLRWGALLAAVVLTIGFLANLGAFLRGGNVDVNHRLDAFTSGRTIMWRQAIQHPPERTWLGVGMGNVGHTPEILDMGSSRQGEAPAQLPDGCLVRNRTARGRRLAGAYRQRPGPTVRQLAKLVAGGSAACRNPAVRADGHHRRSTVQLWLHFPVLRLVWIRVSRRPELFCCYPSSR